MKNRTIRVSRVLGTFTILAMAAATVANAQTAANYPNKPVRIINPYAPGGAATAIAKAYGDAMAGDLGQAFVVDSRPGGSSIIGIEAVTRSAPDGYTLLSISNTVAVIHWTIPNRSYDTLKDLAAVSTTVRNDHLFAVHPSVPANNLNELIAYIKKSSTNFNAYISGLGSLAHLQHLAFMRIIGTQYTVVPYKGIASGTADLLSGKLQLALNTPYFFAPQVKAGKLKAIAISGDRRSPLFPDTPTFTESGLRDFTAGTWYVMFTRGGTPQGIVEKLNASIGKAQASKDFQEMLTKQGIDPFPNSVAASNALLRSELDLWGKIVKEYDVKADSE